MYGTRAAIAHRWACRQFNVSPYDVAAQTKLSNTSNPVTESILGVIGLKDERFALRMMIADIRKSPIPCDSNIFIGESLFFQRPLDQQTLSLGGTQLDSFERGIRNIEVPAELLPFDPSKRLPAEYTDIELIRARELAKALNQTFTVHSPIVGPLSNGDFRTPLFEDAADNAHLIRETIDFAEKIGALTVVVHISDRFSASAINSYADIAFHAVGKTASDGSPLRIAFENYMSKLRPDKTKPFPT